MLIQEIKLKTKNNPNVFAVSTDVGEFVLHSDAIVKFGIKIGEIDSDAFDKALQESAEIIAMNVTMKYISSKVKTEKQIKDYLYKKEFERPIIDKVIDKLKEYKIIDDKMYAEMYIRSNVNFSKNKIKQKLHSFGVKNDMVEDVTNNFDDLESCKYNAQKFMRNKENTKDNIEKLIRRLSYLGFNWDAISSVVNQYRSNNDWD